MGTVLRVGDAGVLDEDIGDCVITATAYGANREAVAARAGSPGKSDILCEYQSKSHVPHERWKLTVPELTAKQSS